MEKESEIIDSISPLERKIIPFLNEKPESIMKKAGIDIISLNRALKFLENKGLLKISSEQKKTIILGTNGIYYKKNHLPERTFFNFLKRIQEWT